MSSTPVRVGIVNYLNTLPLRHGLNTLVERGVITLVQDYPSKIAEALVRNEITIGLVPVAAMLRLPNAQVIGHHCISADGVVASVALFSTVPMQDIKTIYLDYQSKTSVRLLQILCKEFWKIEVQYLDAPNNFIDLIDGDTAAVIIGDRALQHKSRFAFEYDLADAWKQHTGLPFVFAVWLSTAPLAEDFIAQFDGAQQDGISAADHIIANTAYTYYDLTTYLKQNIQYNLTEQKIKSMELFLKASV
jgi:chorismate dehydratase